MEERLDETDAEVEKARVPEERAAQGSFPAGDILGLRMNDVVMPMFSGSQGARRREDW